MTGMPGTPAILAPVDGSRFSEDALPLAATVARLLGADIHLVRTHDPIFLPPPSDLGVAVPLDPRVDADQRLGQSQELARTAAIVRTASGRPVHSALLDGPVAASLCEHANAVGASLIVMATHGRGAVVRAVLGSVATDVVRDGSRPVLLIRPHDGTPPPAPTQLDHALIPLDGSALSEAAIAPALMLLGEHGTITLLRVVAPVTLEMAPTIVPIALGDADLLDEECRTAREYLEQVASMLRVRGYTVRLAVATHPSPATAIADAVRELKPSFVSMATHGRGGIAQLLMGSVANTVLRHVNVPMLLLRPLLALATRDVSESSIQAQAMATAHT